MNENLAERLLAGTSNQEADQLFLRDGWVLLWERAPKYPIELEDVGTTMVVTDALYVGVGNKIVKYSFDDRKVWEVDLESPVSALDVFENRVYVGTETLGVHAFTSDGKHLFKISIGGIGNIHASANYLVLTALDGTAVYSYTTDGTLLAGISGLLKAWGVRRSSDGRLVISYAYDKRSTTPDMIADYNIDTGKLIVAMGTLYLVNSVKIGRNVSIWDTPFGVMSASYSYDSGSSGSFLFKVAPFKQGSITDLQPYVYNYPFGIGAGGKNLQAYKMVSYDKQLFMLCKEGLYRFNNWYNRPMPELNLLYRIADATAFGVNKETETIYILKENKIIRIEHL